MVHDGYQTYPGRILRVPLFTHWTHVVSGPGPTHEVCMAPDTELSPDDASNQVCVPRVHRRPTDTAR
jgi:hypothetical protein